MRFLSKHKRHGDENGVEGGKERIVPSRGFDPVIRILEYELSSSVFTLGGLDSGFLVWRTMETKMRSSLRKNFFFPSFFVIQLVKLSNVSCVKKDVEIIFENCIL